MINRKIVFVAPRYHTNQTEIVRILTSNGFDVSFLVFDKSEPENYELLTPTILKPGIIYSLLSKYLKFFDSINNKRRYQTISLIQLINYLKKKNKCYLIIRNPDVVPGFLALVYGYFFVKKVILYHQAPYYGKKNRKTMTINFLNKIFSTSSYTPVLGNNKSNITIPTNNNLLLFPVPIKKSIRLNVISKSNGNINILSICKFEERKRIPLLINAFERLTYHNIKMTIIGRCVTDIEVIIYNKIEQMISEKKLESNIDILININHKDIDEYYFKNDFFILPSINEPFAYSILEAIGAGLPVICSDSCGSRHYIDEGKNGFIFKSDDTEDLTNKINKLISSDLGKMKKHNRYLSKEVYNEEQFYKNYIEMILK